MTTVSDLEAIAAELTAARREVKVALTLAALYTEQRAREGDVEAAKLAPMITRAFDRLVAANIVGATVLADS